MKKTALPFIACVVVLLTVSTSFCADTIKIAGGAGTMNNVLKPVKPHFEKATGISLSLIEQGQKVALEELLRGNLDASGAILPGGDMDAFIAMMQKEGVRVNKGDVQTFVTGKSRAVVMINKGNPVSKLTKEQLKGIFTGKTDNWKAVGGKDMPIIVVWAKLTPGWNALFINKILDGAPLTKDLIEVATGPDLKQNVVANAEAIGMTIASLADDAVKTPEQPEIASDLILITRGKPSPNVQKLIDFIQGEGKKYTKE